MGGLFERTTKRLLYQTSKFIVKVTITIVVVPFAGWVGGHLHNQTMNIHCSHDCFSVDVRFQFILDDVNNILCCKFHFVPFVVLSLCDFWMRKIEAFIPTDNRSDRARLSCSPVHRLRFPPGLRPAPVETAGVPYLAALLFHGDRKTAQAHVVSMHM